MWRNSLSSLFLLLLLFQQQQQQQAEAAVTAVTADDRPDGQPAESPATSQPDLQGMTVEDS